MKAGRALAALLQRGWAAAPHPSQQQPGALRQLQRGLSGGPFAGRAGGAAAAAPWLAAVAAGLAGGVGLQLYSSTDPAQCRAADKPAASGKGAKEFDKEEVAKHRTKETGGLGVGPPAAVSVGGRWCQRPAPANTFPPRRMRGMAALRQPAIRGIAASPLLRTLGRRVRGWGGSAGRRECGEAQPTLSQPPTRSCLSNLFTASPFSLSCPVHLQKNHTHPNACVQASG